MLLVNSKYKQGVDALTKLIDTLKVSDPLLITAKNYRAFGYVALEKYELAACDADHPIASSACKYNKYLSEGILRMDNEDYLMASKYIL